MADAHAISLRTVTTPGAAPNPIDSARRMYAWRDAIWASDLSTTEKIVALAYADHASSGILRVWVAGERLQQRTGLKRTSSAGAVRRLRVLRGVRPGPWSGDAAVVTGCRVGSPENVGMSILDCARR